MEKKTKEIMERLKIDSKELDINYETSKKILKDIISNAEVLGQTRLIERCSFQLIALDVEKEINSLLDGVLYTDSKSILDTLYLLRERKQTDDIYITRLENYTRIVPFNTTKKIEIINKNIKNKYSDIALEYYILYTDYTNESKFLDEKTVNDFDAVNEKIEPERDPILFLILTNGSEGNKLIVHDRIYLIDDWIDDYCDITISDMVGRIAMSNNIYEKSFKNDKNYEKITLEWLQE